MKPAEFIFLLWNRWHVVIFRKTQKQSYPHKTWRENELKWSEKGHGFIFCYFKRIRYPCKLLFFQVAVQQLLNPLHPFGLLWLLTGLGSRTRLLLMPVDCLWQALMQTPWLPWAITLNTQETARAGLTCGRVKGRERRQTWNGKKEKHPTANSRLCKMLFSPLEEHLEPLCECHEWWRLLLTS